MLAASVVISGTLGSFPHLELAVLLLGTGVAFWIAHVHAQLFGARLARQALDRRTVVEVCRAEWPIVKAAVPPTVAVAVSPLLGLDLQGTFWLALAVAVAGQVGWSAAATSPARHLLVLHGRHGLDQSAARSADHLVQARPDALKGRSEAMRYEIRVEGHMTETLTKAFPEMDHVVMSRSDRPVRPRCGRGAPVRAAGPLPVAAGCAPSMRRPAE